MKTRLDKKSIEILQHGFYDKNTVNGRGEFGHGFGPKTDIEQGRKILSEVFEIEPRFFVPPFDDISKRNLELVLKIGMIPIYRQTNFDAFLRSTYIPHLIKELVNKII